jgi:hypothetical protein
VLRLSFFQGHPCFFLLREKRKNVSSVQPDQVPAEAQAGTQPGTGPTTSDNRSQFTPWAAWLPASARPPPHPPVVSLPRPPPRDGMPPVPSSRPGAAPRGICGPRWCLKQAQPSPLSSVADGAGAPAHRSAEQPHRPLAAMHRRGAWGAPWVCDRIEYVLY